jgi:rare lipoprotein A (peptidoglycan hydrolase)
MTPFLCAAFVLSLAMPGAARAETTQIVEQETLIEQADTADLTDEISGTQSPPPSSPSSPDQNCPPSNLLEAGRASWYGPGFHKKRTANGERFNMNALTAAHRTLPLGMSVRVRNPATGQTVQVRITDRGPYKDGVILDLSRAAARTIGLDRQGVMAVEVLSLDEDDAGLERVGRSQLAPRWVCHALGGVGRGHHGDRCGAWALSGAASLGRLK